MELTQEERLRAHDIAIQIAHGELLRLIISEAFHSSDRDEFRRRLCVLEETAVSGLTNRRHFPKADDEADTYIKETASGYVSRLFASILNPEQ